MTRHYRHLLAKRINLYQTGCPCKKILSKYKWNNILIMKLQNVCIVLYVFKHIIFNFIVIIWLYVMQWWMNFCLLSFRPVNQFHQRSVQVYLHVYCIPVFYLLRCLCSYRKEGHSSWSSCLPLWESKTSGITNFYFLPRLPYSRWAKDSRVFYCWHCQPMILCFMSFVLRDFVKYCVTRR